MLSRHGLAQPKRFHSFLDIAAVAMSFSRAAADVQNIADNNRLLLSEFLTPIPFDKEKE
jgi:hypothetical protein